MQMEYNAHEPAEFLDYFMQSHSIYFYQNYVHTVKE